MSKTPGATTIQNLLANKQYPQALVAVQQLLTVNQDDPQNNYLAAVCARYCRQFELAQQYLDQLPGRFVDQARLLQEQGHLYRDSGQGQQALACYRAACLANPALVSAWQAQLQLAEQMGQPAQLPFIQAQLQRLAKLPKALIAVSDLISQGKLLKAETLCRKFMQANPTHPEGMGLLADLASKFGAYNEAELLLQSALELAPTNTQLRSEYIGVLRRRQKFAEAYKEAEALHKQQPDNPQFQSLLAIEKMQLSDYEGAVALFKRVLARLPQDPITLTSQGHALKTWGKQAEAIKSYQQAAEQGHGEAFYALANLKTYSFSERQIAQLQQLLQQKHLSDNNRVHIEFALGKAFEDAEQFAQSFAHYAAGNRLKKARGNYSAEQMQQELAEQRQYFSAKVFDARSGQGCPSPDPIFIVGLPRAGSTLLEQILSSHSRVDGTLELPNILSYAAELRQRAKAEGYADYYQLLEQLPAQELAAMGQRFIDETRIHRRGAPFFIDKMPNNFRHIGLIKLILPKAKIIDARRHPMACCFSGFKQLFAEGQEFSYALEDIAQYYRDYVALMDHWDKAIPGAVLRVNYESVVADLETQVRRLLDYCGLAFEPACLEFHKTKRAVRTASSEQVRQPIYQSGRDQWRHYESELGELRAHLAGEVKRYQGELGDQI